MPELTAGPRPQPVVMAASHPAAAWGAAWSVGRWLVGRRQPAPPLIYWRRAVKLDRATAAALPPAARLDLGAADPVCLAPAHHACHHT